MRLAPLRRLRFRLDQMAVVTEELALPDLLPERLVPVGEHRSDGAVLLGRVHVIELQSVSRPAPGAPATEHLEGFTPSAFTEGCHGTADLVRLEPGDCHPKRIGLTFMLVDNPTFNGNRAACPICKHPTGDCAPVDAPEHIKILPYANPELDDAATFTVDREVLQELWFGKRRSFVRLFRVGQRITPETAERVGLMEDDRPDRIIVPATRAEAPYQHVAVST